MSENKFSIGDTLIVTDRSVKCRGSIGDVESIIDRHVVAARGCRDCGGWIMYQLSFTASTVFCECVLRRYDNPTDTTEEFKDFIDSLNRDKVTP